MDCDWTMQDPSYISEKWDKYIGVEPNKRELYPSNPQITKWLKIWKVSNEATKPTRFKWKTILKGKNVLL